MANIVFKGIDTICLYKSKKRLIAERMHYNMFCMLRKNMSNDQAYAIASGYCPIFDIPWEVL